MSEISSSLGGAAPSHKITFNGHDYTVSVITHGVKSAYEKALYQRARNSLTSMRADITNDHYARRMDELADRYETGYYTLESEHGRKILATPSGVMLLFSLLMGKQFENGTIEPLQETTVMQIIMAKAVEITALLKVIIKESFPGAQLDEGSLPPQEDAAASKDTPSPKA